MRVLVALLMVGCLARSAAAAPPPDADRVFREASKLFQRGRYAEAAERFAQAFELSPNQAYLFNAAVAWEKAGNLVDALRMLEKFAVFTKNPVRLAAARDQMREIEARLGRTHGRVKVDVDPPGSYVFLDGDEKPLETPFDRWLPAGPHEVVVKRSGYEPEARVLDVVAGTPWTLRVTLVKIQPVGRLFIQTSPAGARVWIDGAEVGKSPTTVKVPVGERHVRLEAPGHERHERTVRVEKDTDLGFTAVLEKTIEAAPIPVAQGGDVVAAPPSIWTRWWLWTAVGAVVVGGVVTAVVLTTDPGTTAAPAAAGGTWAIDRSPP